MFVFLKFQAKKKKKVESRDWRDAQWLRAGATLAERT